MIVVVFLSVLGPKKVTLAWEEDMELHSCYLERKVTKKKKTPTT